MLFAICYVMADVIAIVAYIYMPLYLYVEDGTTLNNLFSVADVITTL